MLVLAIKIAEDSPPREMTITGDRITIGRRQDNDFRIKDPYISAYHAEIVRNGSGGFEIIDLQSFNGTFVRGQRVDRAAVKAGDDLRIGVLEARILEEGQTWDSQPVAPKAKSPVVRSLRERKTSGQSFPAPVAKPTSGESSPGPRAFPSPGKEKPAAVAALAKPSVPDKNSELSAAAAAAFLPSLAIEKAELDLKKVRADLDTTKADLEAARAAEEKVAHEILGSRKKIQALEESNRTLAAKADRETAVLQEKISRLEELNRAFQKQPGEKSVGHHKQTVVPVPSPALSGKEKPREGARKETVGTEQVARKAQGELEDTRRRLTDSRKALEKAQSESTALESSLREKRSELQNLSAKVQKQTEQCEQSSRKASENLADVRTRLTDSQKALEKSRKDSADLEKHLQEQRKKLETLKRKAETTRENRSPGPRGFFNSVSRKSNGGGSHPPKDPVPGTDDARPGESAGISRRINALTSRIPLFAPTTNEKGEAEKQNPDLHTRDIRSIEREPSFEKGADLEKEARQRLKELQKKISETEKTYRQEEKRLEKKLHELKMAEDRIETAAALSEEIARRKEHLTRLENQLEQANHQFENLKAKRDEMTSAISVPMNSATARVSVRATQALETAEEKETLAKSYEEKIAEYEQYQQILRCSLRPDLATVQVMSRQVIRRLDLLENMIEYYRNQNAPGTVDQLRTLRNSFLDLLNDNQVSAYSFPPGTELNLGDRRKIKIIESRNGGPENGGPARILETVRPGYICGSFGDDGETILRKAEVITQS